MTKVMRRMAAGVARDTLDRRLGQFKAESGRAERERT